MSFETQPRNALKRGKRQKSEAAEIMASYGLVSKTNQFFGKIEYHSCFIG
jgi:hypothetical protein